MPYYDTTLGPDVLLVRRTFDGAIVETWIPALLAVDALMNDDDNGVIYEAAWIVDFDGASRQWDVSGFRLMEVEGE